MATKTSHHKDAGAGDAVLGDSRADGVGAVPLPDGWSMRLSRTRNLHYFYNDTTKVSTWKHPLGTNLSSSRTVASSLAERIAPDSSGLSGSGDFKQKGAKRTTSRENGRTPAQSRLNHLQRELREEQKRKETAEQQPVVPIARKRPAGLTTTTKRTPSSQKPAATKSPIKKARLNEADHHAADRTTPHCWFDARHSSTQRQVPAASDAGAFTASNNSPPFAFSAGDQQLPTKSLFGNIFSFAKSVVQSMASPFNSAEIPMQIDSETAASAGEHRSPASAVHRFNGVRQRERPTVVRSPPVRCTSSTTLPVTLPTSSPRTPANNRLHALRHKLSEDQQKTAAAAGIDDVIMTDDDDCTDDDASLTDDESSPMDWDECIEQAGATLGRPIGRIVVLDTNVLIDDLPLIQRIITAQRPDSPNRTQFVVPYIVLKELDGLKMRSRDGTGRHAQRAIKALHEAIKASDWRLQVERPARADRAPKLEITTNDDRILNCALEMRDGESVTDVHVLSNDVNLRNFAMLHGLRSQSMEEFRKEWTEAL